MIRFGPFEVDLATGELRREDAKVPLQDKPFQLLALLLRRPGELVTREELRLELWPADTFVDFEHGLNTAVKKLRQALDDSAETPRFVETLPRRGYRFVAPAFDPEPPVTIEPAPVPAPPIPRPGKAGSWRAHAGWAAVVAIVAATLWPRQLVHVPSPQPTTNARPVVVLMDSPLADRVYDPRTFAAGGTNADDITDALQSLPVSIRKETTSPMWHREDQLVRQNPDLIVSHLSCLLDARFGEPDGEGPVWQHLFDVAENRLLLVFGYAAATKPHTRFLLYSRGRFADPMVATAFVRDTEARLPALRGRLSTVHVPGGDDATFRDPNTARLIRERVAGILNLP